MTTATKTRKRRAQRQPDNPPALEAAIVGMYDTIDALEDLYADLGGDGDCQLARDADWICNAVISFQSLLECAAMYSEAIEARCQLSRQRSFERFART